MLYVHFPCTKEKHKQILFGANEEKEPNLSREPHVAPVVQSKIAVRVHTFITDAEFVQCICQREHIRRVSRTEVVEVEDVVVADEVQVDQLLGEKRSRFFARVPGHMQSDFLGSSAFTVAQACIGEAQIHIICLGNLNDSWRLFVVRGLFEFGLQIRISITTCNILDTPWTTRTPGSGRDRDDSFC
jgi:hypothetical protein